MPSYNDGVLSNVRDWLVQCNAALQASLQFIDPDRGEYDISQFFQYTDNSEPQGSTQCDISGNPSLTSSINQSISNTQQAIVALSSGNNLDLQTVNNIKSVINSNVATLRNLKDHLSAPIPTYESGGNIPVISGLFSSRCAKPVDSLSDLFQNNIFLNVVVPESILNGLLDLSVSGATLPDDLDYAEEIPPSEPLAHVQMDDFTTQKLFDLIERLYRMQNNNFYVVIRRSTEASLNTTTMLKDFETTVSYILETMRRIHDQRVELKEARQGIKDLLGLGDKFYEGSVSTIELLEYMEFAHQSENDALYEINIRAQEIKSYVEAIRLDTQDLKAYIDQKTQEINQYNLDLYNTYIEALNVVRSDIATQMQQNQQQLVEMIIAIDNQVGR